jgi:hypothetical protein
MYFPSYPPQPRISMSTQNRPSFERPRSVATTAWQASSRYGDGLCPWAVWSDLANSGSSVAPSFSTSTGHQNHQMALACITLSPMACIRSCSAAMTALDSSSFRFLADSPRGWGAAWSGATRRRTSAQRVRLASFTENDDDRAVFELSRSRCMLLWRSQCMLLWTSEWFSPLRSIST